MDEMKGEISWYHLAVGTEASVSTWLYLFTLAFVFVLTGKSGHVLSKLGLSVRLADRRGSAARREGNMQRPRNSCKMFMISAQSICYTLFSKSNGAIVATMFKLCFVLSD